MAFSDLDAYLSKAHDPDRQLPWNSTATGALARVCDHWVTRVPANTAPTASVVPAQSTGPLDFVNAAGGTLVPVMAAAPLPAALGGIVIWCDRLSHSGGLSGTVTTAQTTNLPTAALTRYTDGVMAMLTIYATIGTTATTASVSYTDQGGTAGNASPLFDIGGTGRREGGRGILIPCASGDTAFQSIESVTLTGTTGTVGNFGVTLFRPLFAVLSNPTGSAGTSAPLPTYLRGISNLPEILDGACLFPLVVTPGVTSALFGRLDLAEC